MNWTLAVLATTGFALDMAALAAQRAANRHPDWPAGTRRWARYCTGAWIAAAACFLGAAVAAPSPVAVMITALAAAGSALSACVALLYIRRLRQATGGAATRHRFEAPDA